MSAVDLSKLDAWKKMQADAAQQRENLSASTFGGGGPTFTEMDAVDAKIAAAEARTDTKFAQVMGELGKINTRLDHVPTLLAMISAVFGTGIAILAIAVGVFGWGSQMFGTGMDVQSVSDHSARNALLQVQPKFDAIDAQFADLNKKIGTLIDAVQKTPQQPEKQ